MTKPLHAGRAAENGIRVFTASLGSFDTHSGQPAEHAAGGVDLLDGELFDAAHASILAKIRRIARRPHTKKGPAITCAARISCA